MSLHVYEEIEQGSPEWHDQRRGLVTASVVGQLLTVRTLAALDYHCPACPALRNEPCQSKVKRDGESGAPIKTLHPERIAAAAEYAADSPPVIEVANTDTSRGLTALLVAERITGYTDPTWQNDDMLRGVMSEPIARDLYSKHHAPATEVGFMVRDDWGFRIGYSPDGLVGNDGLIEVKAPRAKSHLRTVISGEVPAHHIAQIQCGLLVSGRQYLDFISFSAGMPMFVKRVLPDPAWHEAIIAAVEAFEVNAAQMTSDYLSAVVGLPETERINLDIGLVF